MTLKLALTSITYLPMRPLLGSRSWSDADGVAAVNRAWKCGCFFRTFIPLTHQSVTEALTPAGLEIIIRIGPLHRCKAQTKDAPGPHPRALWLQSPPLAIKPCPALLETLVCAKCWTQGRGKKAFLPTGTYNPSGKQRAYMHGKLLTKTFFPSRGPCSCRCSVSSSKKDQLGRSVGGQETKGQADVPGTLKAEEWEPRLAHTSTGPGSPAHRPTTEFA